MVSGPGARVVYDIESGVAHLGAATVPGSALVWEVTPCGPDIGAVAEAEGAVLSRVVALDDSRDWLVRCDRVDFPPGAVAHWHRHPGPGIRRLLFGELTVTTGGVRRTHQPTDPWFEIGPEPVLAEASAEEDSAFVRVLLLPAEWAGRRTIRYVDPVKAGRGRQRAKVFLEAPLA